MLAAAVCWLAGGAACWLADPAAAGETPPPPDAAASSAAPATVAARAPARHGGDCPRGPRGPVLVLIVFLFFWC
jgi:hypothetical protein